jgi:hypothetical protein
MPATLLPRHLGLGATTRFRAWTNQAATPALHDWLLLAALGVVAAWASTFLDLGLRRVPGHAILRVVFPMALGLALVPRRGAGCVMGGTAALAAAGLHLAGVRGEGLGLGAFTSLIATGPLLDVSLRRAQGGWRQTAAFVVAGLTSNLMALGVRGATKALGWEAPGRRPLGEWLFHAVGTYVLCGIVAGLVSAVALFSWRGRVEPVRT